MWAEDNNWENELLALIIHIFFSYTHDEIDLYDEIDSLSGVNIEAHLDFPLHLEAGANF